MERIRPAEAATVALVGAFGLAVALPFAALGLLAKAPTESFHLAGLGLAGLGAAVAALAELAA